MSRENNTQLITMEGRTDLVADLTTSEMAYCSFLADTPEEKRALFTAMNNPTYRLEEKINMTIMVRDVYAETVDFVNETTGEITKGIRVILIDDEGNSYGCCAMGVYSSLKKLMKVYGEPTWLTPIPVIPYTVPSRTRQNAKVLTLKLG